MFLSLSILTLLLANKVYRKFQSYFLSPYFYLHKYQQLKVWRAQLSVFLLLNNNRSQQQILNPPQLSPNNTRATFQKFSPIFTSTRAQLELKQPFTQQN